MAVDPTDPSIIYVGGTADGNQTGLIRINLTDIWDAHSLVAYSASANDGGALNLSSTGPAAVADKTIATSTVNGQVLNVDPGSYLNYIRDPGNPFEANATLDVYNYSQFTNNGAGVEWIPFDVGGTDYHRIVTMVDPTTGLPRLIFGNDQGIWSVLDNSGTFETQIGASDSLPGNSRNGNLQITQFYYGAAQPSNAAALIAGSLFYGSAQDNGGPQLSRRHHQQRRHRMERARRRRRRRGHQPARQRHNLPILLALLRRRRYQFLPGQRRWPDLRLAPGQRR